MSARDLPTALSLFKDGSLWVATVATVLGGGLYLLGVGQGADWAWAAATIAVLAPATVGAILALRQGQSGIDTIALVAMTGALALHQLLAGAVIALMLAGGGKLERYAEARARKELAFLLRRSPKVVQRCRLDGSGAIEEVDASRVQIGDVLVVRSGEVLSADGILLSASAVLDESALTGESKPVTVAQGTPLRSGGTNVGGALTLRVTASPADSTYSAIIRIVEAAERSKAPFVRMADKGAGWFLGLTLAVAALTWLLSADPVRALAVLVIASPCSLILAVPAAIVAGLSCAARDGIIVKGGGPLEKLAKAKVLLLDKTGTVTAASPRLVSVETLGTRGRDEIVTLAAAAEQVSIHPFAPAIVEAARKRGLDPPFPRNVVEEAGIGISADVDGHSVRVGQLGWVVSDLVSKKAARSVRLRAAIEGAAAVYVAVDGNLEGALVLQDPIRPEAPRVLGSLRKAGFSRIFLVTGDHPDVAELVGDAIGADRVFSERTPSEKLDVVQALRSEGLTVMVGDGINDAPALAMADVGVAMGSRGATAASEAADLVLTKPSLGGLVRAVNIARRTRVIAIQCVSVGLSMSVIGMGAAVAGYLTPVAGALLQEAIDILVILNALRALGDGAQRPIERSRITGLSASLARAHEVLRPQVEALSSLAARLDGLPPGVAQAELVSTCQMLEGELLPHERDEQRQAFPIISALTRPEDPTSALLGTHREIQRLSRLLARLVAQVPAEGPDPIEVREIQRVLYGLGAVLGLHFSQEDELYSLLGD